MKKSLTLLTITALSACTTLGDVEKDALKQAAIDAAKNQNKEVHLAYLQCYALRDLDKKDCKHAAKKLTTDRQGAVTWEYILPFDYESERLGFKAFLKEKNKPCAGIDQGPKFNKETKAYDVICTDENRYAMRFDYENNQWELAE